MNYKKVALVVGTVGAMAMGIATPFVAEKEGLVQQAYLDPVEVPTICYGHTQTVYIGQFKTKQECDQLLSDELSDYMIYVDKHVIPELPAHRLAALASFTYNVGKGNFRRSTLLKKLNAGDVVGACHELDRWVFAKGRKLQGLVKRRADERDMCLIGAG